MAPNHYSEQLSSEGNGYQLQSPLNYIAQPEESDEGGLDISQLLETVQRRILVVVGVTITVASAAAALALTATPKYEAKFELLIAPATVEDKLTASPLDETKAPTEDVSQSVIKVLQSPKLMSPIVKQLQAQYPGSGLPEIIFNPIKQTNILEVSYQDADPKKVKTVLDIVSNSYLGYSLQERQSTVLQGIQFVEGQLPKMQQNVESLQGRLQKFRQQHGLIDPQNQGQQLSNQLNTIVQQRLETQTQLAKNRSLYTNLQSQLGLQPNEAVAASALSEAPRYQKLLDALQELQTKIATESARYSEDSPTVQNLRAQEQNLLPLVQQEAQRVILNKLPNATVEARNLSSPNSIRLQQIQQFLDAANQIQALQAQNQALAQAENALRQQFKEFPVLVRQNDDLERQLKIAVDNLNQFMIKRQALQVDIAQKQTPWQLLTPPTNPQPSLISVRNSFILGAALGLLLGIAAALIVDKFNNVFYTPEEIRNTTRLIVLGEIPFKQKTRKVGWRVPFLSGLMQWVGNRFKLRKRNAYYHQYNVSHFWESLHSLYTNIRFLGFDRPVRSIMIISATPEDGKSTIALHLAHTAAAMGQRVLLVDADLRHPSLHTMLNLSNTTGLSNVIAEEIDFNQVIHSFCEASVDETRELPPKNNLFVLTAGQIPPNPTTLLSSQKMKYLAEQFKAAFDLVIYDTPPVLGLADSSVLSAHIDGSLLIVSLRKTDRSALVKVLEKLRISYTPVLGVVANGVSG